MIKFFPVTVLVFGFMVSCSETPVPKPLGELRLEYPEPSYTLFSPNNCPFQLEISRLARAEPGKSACYFNIFYPSLKAKLFLTYQPVHTLGNLVAENEKIVFKHTIKASNIVNKTFTYPDHKVSGNYYKIEGEAASNVHFYATDSSAHFISASLYFKTRPNPDSLAPAIDYVERDLKHMLSTLTWK